MDNENKPIMETEPFDYKEDNSDMKMKLNRSNDDNKKKIIMYVVIGVVVLILILVMIYIVQMCIRDSHKIFQKYELVLHSYQFGQKHHIFESLLL